MARKAKPVRKPKPKPLGKERWKNLQIVQSANGLPVYIQQRLGGDVVAYRAVNLCDTKLQTLSFWSDDRGMDVEESADLSIVMSAAARATVQFTKTVDGGLDDSA